MIDFHCHIGRIDSDNLNEKYGIPEKAGAEFLLRTLEGIEEVDVAFATPCATPHVGYANSLNWLLSEVHQYEELYPVPVLHPQLEVTEIFLDKINPELVPGIKLHCGSSEFGYSLNDTAILEPLFSFAETNGLIVFIHTDGHSCIASDLNPLLEGYQGKVVLLHCCRREGVKLTHHPCVYLETSGCTQEDIDFAMNRTPDRIVFGSDFPFFDYDISLTRIENHIGQIEQNEQILVRNSI